jgi:hypothetical protein
MMLRTGLLMMILPVWFVMTLAYVKIAWDSSDSYVVTFTFLSLALCVGCGAVLVVAALT